MKNPDLHASSSLLIIRTPFQAWLAQKVLKHEEISSYDLLYFTHNDSEEDKFYYNELSKTSRYSSYVYVKPKRRDILTQVALRWRARSWFSKEEYGKVFLASINSHLANALAHHYSSSDIVSFDDGAANIFSDGGYFKESIISRDFAYRKILGGTSLNVIKLRIVRHYTVFSGFENIVENDKIVSMQGWVDRFDKAPAGQAKTYFIGAPFSEIFTQDQIVLIEAYMKKQHIDVYVRHPREQQPLDIGAAFLDKKGRIAEEAILKDADCRPIVLIGYLSSVMFTLVSCAEKRIVLMPRGAYHYHSLIDLARKAGCEIVSLDETRVYAHDQ